MGNLFFLRFGRLLRSRNTPCQILEISVVFSFRLLRVSTEPVRLRARAVSVSYIFV